MKTSNKVNDFCECTSYYVLSTTEWNFHKFKRLQTLTLFAFKKGLTTAQLGFASPSIAELQH